MASREQVDAWRELAAAAQREYPGWWLRIEDQLRRLDRRPVTSSARMSVAAHIAASHESVPDMCDMLARAMAVMERLGGADAGQPARRDADVARLLDEWRAGGGPAA